MLLPPPRPTLFPYTTLFRSQAHGASMPDRRLSALTLAMDLGRMLDKCIRDQWSITDLDWSIAPPDLPREKEEAVVQRSEEHMSELQSRQYLVCRLLLEKKKR